ncbi:hypothetical protein G6O69_16900 [Pseudenhygromyxa sp. WMMC2535]|uniref:hypothetical protein n=1 Tax=Pseudenhygromyxa sp. WMMC2535 TaxID=2712867 RepID=UPI001553F888|nr:hypothetical protein [Pseudenhygromyxa sp. WMMC2535]NVB39523.1 hypothetical protein [Pseudenhygromyxa sp. WMMC2535]
MTFDELAALLESTTQDFRQTATHWQFVHEGIPMACLTDLEFDRMRFISPITELVNLDEPTKDRVLEANFHTALDGRYCVSNGLLFAAFIHPMSSLDPALARSALDQVASLVHSFGTRFSSGELEFMRSEEGEGFEDEDDDDDEPLLN